MVSSVEILKGKFDVRFPELAGISADEKTMYIEDALTVHNLTDRAALYLAAHLYTLDRDQPNGGIDDGLGEITSDKIGQKSTTVKSVAARSADVLFSTTPYGRKYLLFRQHATGRSFSARIY